MPVRCWFHRKWYQLHRLVNFADLAFVHVQAIIGACAFHVDTDECSEPDMDGCAAAAVCTNSIGSYLCTCIEGYSGNGTYCEGNVKLNLHSL